MLYTSGLADRRMMDSTVQMHSNCKIEPMSPLQNQCASEEVHHTVHWQSQGPSPSSTACNKLDQEKEISSRLSKAVSTMTGLNKIKVEEEQYTSMPCKVEKLSPTSTAISSTQCYKHCGGGGLTTKTDRRSKTVPMSKYRTDVGNYDRYMMAMNGHRSSNVPPYSDTCSLAAKHASYAVADSNTSSKTTFTPCKVCGDKASGYHYGVTSCEGCKGFFRRSIQKQIEYRCLRDGKCLVIRLNRNRCQYCRFKKCLAVGMSRDSVRYGRVPKRSKEKEEQERRVSTTGDPMQMTDLESKQLAIYDIILTISQSHHGNCAFTEDKIKSMTRKPAQFNMKFEGDSLLSTQDAIDQQSLYMWQQLAHLITPSISRVVEFSKRVPGFGDLAQDDQLILIKSGFFEIWLVRIARMFSPIDDTVTFGDGSYITKKQLEMMTGIEIASALFSFAFGFNNLNLNDTEIGLFCAVVLLTADRPNVTDIRTVGQQQDKLIEALKLQITRNHSSEPHLFPTLLMRLPELRTLGNKHNEYLHWFRMQWMNLQLPPLFAEIYDIPRCEDDLLP